MATKQKKRERKKSRDFKMPLHVQQGREPHGPSPLLSFILSCNGEVSANEAIRVYQEEWCEHPKQIVISTIAQPGAERFEYHIACTECGVIKLRQGRPPSRAQQ